MTKSRKIGVSIALALAFVLLCAVVIPLYNVNDVASAVTVESRDEWVNPYNGTYYTSIENSNNTGAAFRSELASLITSTHTRQTSYDYLKTLYKTSDSDPNKSGNIIWFYTGTSASYNGSLGSSSGTTNREHVWAKTGGSTFEPEAGPGSDGHHLRPTEALLNNARSNYGFGIVEQSNANIVAEAGSKNYGTYPDGLCYLASYGGSKLFYPAKGYRGATARILFYMQVRWGDQYNLDFIDGVTTNNGKNIGKISDLMRWHLEEPPTDEEIRRNNVVANYQGNRNPFIDHPEYAEIIYCNNNASYSNTLKTVVATYGGYLGNSNVNPNPEPDPTPTPTPTPDIDNPAQAFNESMQALNNATTLQGRYDAIKNAVNAYNQMSDSEKAANASGYSRLRQELELYNDEIAKVNDDFDSANNLAAQVMVNGISISFMALVAIVVKGLLGGV